MVIYELHVGSFLFDPASPGGRGSFNTVISNLPYLADLGINVIHVLPAASSRVPIQAHFAAAVVGTRPPPRRCTTRIIVDKIILAPAVTGRLRA